jgi:Mn2+/Fe2+ NRAMP family transporter
MGNRLATAPRKMGFLARFFYRYRRVAKAIRLFLIIAGPGIIVMVADNDAGGITTYAITGSNYGYSLIWFMILLCPAAYVVQEMCVRLGAVTKRGHAEAIFDAFGPFWGWFSLIDLTLTDFLTIVTEFIGMTAALAIFHIPPIATVAVVIILIMAMVMQGRYWTWEKLVLVFCVLNLIYIPAAFLVHPSVSDILHQGFIPNFLGGFNSDLFFLLMANVGTTIAPWMVFFHQSAVVDKGLQEKDISWERVDTALGSLSTVITASFIIVVTGTVLRGVKIESAAQAAGLLMGINRYVGTFLAIGLFDAGLLGAICISLASSWALGEVFGWAHSLNVKIRQAPWFFLFRFVILVAAGIVVLIPGAPLVLITLFVQVIAVTLLPAALVFLILLLNDKELVGKYKNNLAQNILACGIVGMIIVLSTLFGLSTLFPSLFK